VKSILADGKCFRIDSILSYIWMLSTKSIGH